MAPFSLRGLLTLFCVILFSSGSNSAFCQVERFEFFETRIRPVLVDHCYPCHNSIDDAEGDLAVDWRDAIRSESGEGTAVVPFQTDESLLLKVIRHEIPGLEMPDGSAKLSDEVIADFEKWIADGARDPRMHAPTREQFEAATSWEETFERRREWWCFQPVKDVRPPDTGIAGEHPIDAFIRTRLADSGLQPSVKADRATLIRRLSYTLTGLPPTVEETRRFVVDDRPDAFERLVDRYLASPRYGERWARHWMDLVRYADTHGSEGDPAIPHAYRYRDYLIRAFNNDVPYDQLVREHLAGDLLDEPRINQELGLNESAIGTAHLRLVFHGFAPTDALDEKVRFTDDQINVFSKAFQALTVSCARCHDHKFDAISQADYYALFGVFGSCRPAMQDVNTSELQSLNRERMLEIKSELRSETADFWLDDIDNLPGRLMNNRSLGAASPTPRHSALSTWHQVHSQSGTGEDLSAQIEGLFNEYRSSRNLREGNEADLRHWSSSAKEEEFWYRYGNGLDGNESNSAGDFSLAFEGESVFTGVYPAAVLSHSLSTRHRAIASSPRVQLDGDFRVWFKVAGGGSPSVRYVVQNYPRDGTVYPINNVNREDWHWHQYDMTYWAGDHVHFELATSRDAPLRVGNDPRSWFGIREVIVRPADQPGPETDTFEYLEPLFTELGQKLPESSDELATCYAEAIRRSVARWKRGEADDQDALFIDACLRASLLSNKLDQFPAGARELITEYRRLESEIPEPTRVPGVAEADAFDQPLFERGNHKKPLASVPRRYLDAVDPSPFDTRQSGRLQLADALFQEANPLTSRVIANRIWHSLFGAGIVRTPDNFGLLGAPPTHPELLDYLAARMSRNSWSIKEMIRFIVLSDTWQQASIPSEQAIQVDPENKLLSCFSLRRLDAESIRDSLLKVSGELDDTMYGPGDAANPDSKRRSLYMQIRRNQPDAFLSAFDLPQPFSTTGSRLQTNVPAQSLTLMNDPFVMDLARRLGRDILTDDSDSREERLNRLFTQVMGRPPVTEELIWLNEFIAAAGEIISVENQERAAVQRQIRESESAIENIIGPARQRILDVFEAESFESEQENRPGQTIAPVARWDFTQSLVDQTGGLQAELLGGGRQTPQGLFLNGTGFVATQPLDFDLSEKTLLVRARLSTLDLRGAGLMTVQDLDGNVFDSIVFGEQAPREWLAGSNHFARTQPLDGEPDDAATSSPVQIAVVYEADGTIRAYRNGAAYGTAYRKSEIAGFTGGAAQVVFGIRHGTSVTPDRMFKGYLLDAMLFDRALSSEEIAAVATGQPFVSRQQILDSLSRNESAALDELEKKLTELRDRAKYLGEEESVDEAWAQTAHALFNLKEFIYLR